MSVSRIKQITPARLQPLVEKALGKPVSKVPSVDHQVLKGDPLKPQDRLVCRFSGEVRTGDRNEPWSVILKIPNPTHTHWEARNREPFQREVLMYESGVLKGLGGNMAAPECYEIWKPDNDEPWMWLEDIQGIPGRDWTMKQFAAMARHFGAMQGAFASNPMPDQDWLDTTKRVRTGHDNLVQKMDAMLEEFKAHELTGKLMAGEFGKRLLKLWSKKDIFLKAYYNAPRTLMHGDFCTGNLFSRKDRDGNDQTVAIDWQYSGITAVGTDMGGLIADRSAVTGGPKKMEPEEFTPLMMDAYLAGFKEGGWQGNLQKIRLATYCILVIPWGVCAALGLQGKVIKADITGANREKAEERLEWYIRDQEYLFTLADEASNIMKAG